MKKRTVTISLSIIAALILVSGILIVVLEKKSPVMNTESLEYVKIGYRDHVGYLPAYLAKAEGFYEKNGLDVELVGFDSTDALVNAVLTKDVAAAIGGVNAQVVLTVETKASGQLKIFSAGYFNKDYSAILVAKDSLIQDVTDLNKKTVGVFSGSQPRKWMQLIQEKENISFEIVEMSTTQQLPALSSGSVDAIFVLAPMDSIGSSKNISRTLIQDPVGIYFTKDFLFTTSVMSSEYLNDNPDAAERIIKSTNDAIDFINNNQNVAKSYYSEFTSVDDSIEQSITVLQYEKNTDIAMDELQKTADMLYSYGLVAKSVNVTPLVIK